MVYNIFNKLLQCIETEKDFISYFLYIRTKGAKLIKLIFNKAQNKIYSAIQKQREESKPVRVIVLKSRRVGSSTITEALLYTDTIRRDNIHSMVLAHELSSANEIYQMTQLFDEKLAFPLTKTKCNTREIAYEKNRSKIVVDTAEDINVGRAGAYTNLHCSEVAHYRDAELMMPSLLSTVPNTRDTMIILESTANGIGGKGKYFYDMWKKAERGEIDFVPVFIGWQDDPDNIISIPVDFKMTREENKLSLQYGLSPERINWRRNKIASDFNGNEELFAQEYPINPDEAFIGSGRPVFNISCLKRIEPKKPIKQGSLTLQNNQIILEEHYGGALEIWHTPNTNGSYVIGADTAEGLENGDNCGAIVRDRLSWEQCAILWGKFQPHEFASELELLGKYYNYARIGVEANNQGIAVLHELCHNLRYTNLFHDEGWDDIKRIKTKKLGFWTDTKSKPLIINDLAKVINEEQYKIYSKQELNELIMYSYLDSGKMGAPAGEYDDLVMSEAICLYLLIKNPDNSSVKRYIPPLSRPNVAGLTSINRNR